MKISRIVNNIIKAYDRKVKIYSQDNWIIVEEIKKLKRDEFKKLQDIMHKYNFKYDGFNIDGNEEYKRKFNTELYLEVMEELRKARLI